MITEFSTLPKKIYFVQTSEDCTVLDADGEPLAEISAPGGYFPGIGAPDAATGTVTFSPAVKRVIGPFDLAPQLQLTLLGLLGGNADGLPAGYTPLEYLESTGTQYINSEVNPGTYVNIIITIERVAQLTSYDVFLGKMQDTEVGVSRMNIAASGSEFMAEFGWWPYPSFDITISQKLNITFESEIGDIESSKTTVNGEVVTQEQQLLYFRGDVSTLTDPLYFFARNTAGSPTAYSCCRLYSCRIKTQTAQATFVPALDNLGNPGLYCPETKTFLTNLGTGEFSYPGQELQVSTFSRRRPVTFAQLTAHGLRRLYRVPRGYNGTKEEYAAEHGFKPLVETPQPAEGYWAPVWRETAEEIVLDWVETEPPAELETA